MSAIVLFYYFIQLYRLKHLVKIHSDFYNQSIKAEAYTFVFLITDEILRLETPINELAREIENCIE